MNKIVVNHGVKYDADILVRIKGQGTVVTTLAANCEKDSSTIVSETLDRPIVVKHGDSLLILIDSVKPRNEAKFSVTLVSKHVLKKANIDLLEKAKIAEASEKKERDFSRNSFDSRNNDREPYRNNGFKPSFQLNNNYGR